MIPSILDSFSINGPNGDHICYVTTPAKGSLSDMKNGSLIRLVQLEIARALAAQLAFTVDYVHSEGVVHGDLHLGNILLELPPNLNQLSVEELYEKYGVPDAEPVVHLDGEPLPPGAASHGIMSLWLGEASENIPLTESRLVLADFGESFMPSEDKRYESHTPLVM